jgi:hypothetical protein
MIALIRASNSSSGAGGRPRRRAGAGFGSRLDRATPSVLAAAFTGNRRAATVARAAAVFFGIGALQRLAQDLGLERLLAEQAVQFADLLLKRAIVGGRHH